MDIQQDRITDERQEHSACSEEGDVGGTVQLDGLAVKDLDKNGEDGVDGEPEQLRVETDDDGLFAEEAVHEGHECGGEGEVEVHLLDVEVVGW